MAVLVFANYFTTVFPLIALALLLKRIISKKPIPV